MSSACCIGVCTRISTSTIERRIRKLYVQYIVYGIVIFTFYSYHLQVKAVRGTQILTKCHELSFDQPAANAEVKKTSCEYYKYLVLVPGTCSSCPQKKKYVRFKSTLRVYEIKNMRAFDDRFVSFAWLEMENAHLTGSGVYPF